MEWHDRAFVLTARRHGESAAIVELLTEEHGRHAGLVRGGQSPKLRAVLQPGNEVTAVWRGRLSEHLGTIVCELVRPHAAGLLDDPDRLAGLTAAAALVAAALPEREPYPDVFASFEGLLQAIDSGIDWPAHYVEWERDLLAGLGSVWISAAARSRGSQLTSPMFRPARGARCRERQVFRIMISYWYS